MQMLRIDLDAPGISFHLTGPAGSRETVRQTTLAFLQQEKAQAAINAHFFLPFPSTDINSDLIGLASSGGNVFSAFEEPAQSYALVAHAPALNIDRSNRASIVHHDSGFADGKHVREPANLWTAVSGSAQIITGGKASIPTYIEPPDLIGLLTPGGPGKYSRGNSWYEAPNARTVIGLSADRRTLFLFVADRSGGGLGMKLSEVAELLARDYGVHEALNLDGGGSTTLAMEDPATGVARILNSSSDNPNGRAVGSNLAVFATAVRVAPKE